MGDVWEDPNVRRWVKRVETELVPMIEGSAVSLSIVPEGETDVKFAVELGMSLMLGKPIILAVRPGVQVPDGLVRAADAIVEIDLTKPEQARDAIGAAVTALLGGGGDPTPGG